MAHVKCLTMFHNLCRMQHCWTDLNLIMALCVNYDYIIISVDVIGKYVNDVSCGKAESFDLLSPNI